MNRAVVFTLCLALALPAAAGDKISGAIRDVVARKVEEREAAKEDAHETDLPVTANVGNKSSPSRWHSVFWGDPDYSLNVASCPMDAAGAPTFEEVRTYFRDFTDNEMWKVCVNRNSYQGAIAGACACSLLSNPNPWRPVEVEPPRHDDDEGDSEELADVKVGSSESSQGAPRIGVHP